jgi:hypothetical protein
VRADSFFQARRRRRSACHVYSTGSMNAILREQLRVRRFAAIRRTLIADERSLSPEPGEGLR